MRILITGGFGFVGGRLAQHLQQFGHHVVLGSRAARSSPSWLPEASVVEIDWSDSEALRRICEGIDVVVQAAGMNAQESAAHPREALEVNGVNAARILEAATAAGVGKFIYLSTAHVYSNPLTGSISESTCPRNLHPYATSHLAGENEVLRAGVDGLIQGVVIRLSNAFGAPAHKDANCWGLLVNDLCKQAVETGQMTLRSSGAQQRDFIAMADVCQVFESLCSVETSMPQSVIFNLGSGMSQSVLEMAQLIQLRCQRVLGFEPQLKKPPAGDGELHEKLQYGSDRLVAMGIRVGLSQHSELDGLLRFCQAVYTDPRSQS
jgi:UDP-glucose 4-epimerase